MLHWQFSGIENIILDLPRFFLFFFIGGTISSWSLTISQKEPSLLWIFWHRLKFLNVLFNWKGFIFPPMFLRLKILPIAAFRLKCSFCQIILETRHLYEWTGTPNTSKFFRCVSLYKDPTRLIKARFLPILEIN